MEDHPETESIPASLLDLIERFIDELQLHAERGISSSPRTNESFHPFITKFENTGLLSLTQCSRALATPSDDISEQILRARYICQVTIEASNHLNPVNGHP